MTPLSDGAVARIRAARAAAETPATALLTALTVVQAERRRVGPEEIACVADLLGLSPAHVQGVARFYDRVTAQAVGEHQLGLCEGIACYLRGADAVAEAAARSLGTPAGGTTPDGRWTFRRVPCIGACDRAPAALLDDTTEGPLTEEAVVRRLQSAGREGG